MVEICGHETKGVVATVGKPQQRSVGIGCTLATPFGPQCLCHSCAHFDALPRQASLKQI